MSIIAYRDNLQLIAPVIVVCNDNQEYEIISTPDVCLL